MVLKAARLSETLVSYHIAIQRHNPVGRDLNLHRLEILKISIVCKQYSPVSPDKHGISDSSKNKREVLRQESRNIIFNVYIF